MWIMERLIFQLIWFFWALNYVPVIELYISHALLQFTLEGILAPGKELVRSPRPVATAGTEVRFVWIQATSECNNDH